MQTGQRLFNYRLNRTTALRLTKMSFVSGFNEQNNANLHTNKKKYDRSKMAQSQEDEKKIKIENFAAFAERDYCGFGLIFHKMNFL